MVVELNERFFAVVFSSQTVKRDGRIETLLSLVDPVSATVSVFPAIPFQEVIRLAFTSQQHANRLYRHGSGGRGGGQYFPSFPNVVT